jgi:hypothetical protein
VSDSSGSDSIAFPVVGVLKPTSCPCPGGLLGLPVVADDEEGADAEDPLKTAEEIMAMTDEGQKSKLR